MEKKVLLDVTRSNREAWDASAAAHERNPNWVRLCEGFKDPSFSTFDSTATDLLTTLPIVGKSVVQIGCNNGREILSALNLGASRGLGIDQSAEFLAQAEQLRSIAQIDCEFLNSNIYELPQNDAVDFDLALITIGVLNWMPDLTRFFKIVSERLKGNGQLLIYETHPFLEMFNPEAVDFRSPSFSYFKESPFQQDEAIVYDDSEEAKGPVSFWYIHRLGEIVTACAQAGLTINSLVEYPHSNRETAYDGYENQPAQLPMSFSLLAKKDN